MQATQIRFQRSHLALEKWDVLPGRRWHKSARKANLGANNSALSWPFFAIHVRGGEKRGEKRSVYDGAPGYPWAGAGRYQGHVHNTHIYRARPTAFAAAYWAVKWSVMSSLIFIVMCSAKRKWLVPSYGRRSTPHTSHPQKVNLAGQERLSNRKFGPAKVTTREIS